MSNTPDITQDIFNANKRYFGGALQQGKLIFDWDLNDKFNQFRWWILKTGKALSESGRFVAFDDIRGLEVQPTTIPGNDILIKAGAASVNGRFIIIDSDFNYTDENENYITTGELSTITEVVPSGVYNITDSEKLWTAGYSLIGCRIKFESGPLTGQYFLISSVLGQTLQIVGNLSTAAVGNSYRIVPPEITTPSVNGTDNFFLVTWFEDISEQEDTTLTDPKFQDSPSHRTALRYVIHKNYSGVQSSDVMSGHMALQLGAVTRIALDATIDSADITNTPNFIFTIKQLTEDINNAQSDISTIQGQNLDTRATALEATALKSNVIDKLEYRHSAHNGVQIATDPANNDIVYSNGQLYSKYKAADTTDPNVFDITGSSISNATGGSSFIIIDVADPSDDSFSLLQRTSTNLVEDRNINLVSLFSEPSLPFNTIRSFPMADMPQQVGFDWTYRSAPSSVLTINPGWAYRWGTLYQQPDHIILDPTAPGVWDTSAIPVSNSWSYIYLETQANRRDLTATLSELPPKWNGEHPTRKAFLVGIFFYDVITLDTVVCKNNTVYWNDGDLNLLSVTGISTLQSGLVPNLPVPGALEAGLLLESDTVTSFTIINVTTSDTVSASDEIGSTKQFRDNSDRSVISLPMMQNFTYNITHTNIADNSSIDMKWLKFNPLYAPDITLWRTT